MTAAISLRIPHERAYHGVARLVVGGLATRLDLSYEHLEDLQLALASILENEDYGAEREVTIELAVDGPTLELAIGPLHAVELEADLARESGDGIGLGRLLATVVEQVEVEKRDDGGWVRLEKRVRLPEGGDGGA